MPAPPLKEPKQFRLIGKPVARLDTPAKCNGSAIYGIDVAVPGMLNAAIKTAPSFTGRVVAIKNEADILKMPGVRAVVKIPVVPIANEDDASQQPDSRGLPGHNAVCVVADYFWQAKRAVDALDVTFDGGVHGDLSSAKIDAMLETALNAEKGVPALERGRPREILADHASAVIERRYVLPHIAHAPHEPVNATASYRNGAVEVWGPIQSVTACQEAVADALGCPADKVAVNVTFLGGSFGRKIVPDFVVQAAHASKAVGRPVKLIRSREEDMQHDVYRPNAGSRMRAVLDDNGYPLAVHARSPASRCSTPRARTGSTTRRSATGTRAWSTASTIRATGCRTSWSRRSTRRCRCRSISCARSARPRRCSSGRASSPSSRIAPRPISTPIAAICSRTIRWRCACSTPPRRAAGWDKPSPDTFRGIALQLLCRPRRPVQDLCRDSLPNSGASATGSRSSAWSARSIRDLRSIRTR